MKDEAFYPRIKKYQIALSEVQEKNFYSLVTSQISLSVVQEIADCLALVVLQMPVFCLVC